MFDTCAKYNISILLDVHGAMGSQNGFDNSGRASAVWLSDNQYNNTVKSPQWLTQFDKDTQKNGEVDYSHLSWSLKTSEDILIRWGNHSAFAAFEPVNEPLWTTRIDVLKDYYRQVRKLVRRYAP
jgi:glucan 1,3-beta-glucosidase